MPWGIGIDSSLARAPVKPSPDSKFLLASEVAPVRRGAVVPLSGGGGSASLPSRFRYEHSADKRGVTRTPPLPMAPRACEAVFTAATMPFNRRRAAKRGGRLHHNPALRPAPFSSPLFRSCRSRMNRANRRSPARGRKVPAAPRSTPSRRKAQFQTPFMPGFPTRRRSTLASRRECNDEEGLNLPRY